MYKFKIDKRNPLFFVHIPKTAGTSMRMFLADQYANQPICPAVDWAGLLNIAPENISGFDLIQGHFGVNLKPLIRPDAKTLVLLRNPLNRTLSALRHLKRDPNFHALHEHVKDMSVGEILSDPALFEMQSNVQTALLSARSNPNSILRYLRDGPPLKDHQPDPADLEEVVADLDIAKQNLEQIDFIGICESLDEFLPGFCRAMGYHPLQSFRRDNGAPDGLSDFAALAADEIELLKACNKLDLELYDYAVKLAASRRAESEVTYSTLSDAVLGLRDAGTYATCDQTFEVDLAGPIPGSGWYEPELADDGTCARILIGVASRGRRTLQSHYAVFITSTAPRHGFPRHSQPPLVTRRVERRRSRKWRL
jgi:hypothetical protein